MKSAGYFVFYGTLLVVAVWVARASGFNFQHPKVKQPQKWVVNEGQVLNIFQRNGFLHAKQSAFLEFKVSIGEAAFEVVVNAFADVLADAEQPQHH